MANADTAKLMRIRAEEVLDRGAAGTRSAGELAGRFAAMLEQLNGVSAGSGQNAVEAMHATRVGGPLAEPRVALGAVSLFAQSAETEDAGDQPPFSGDAAEVVANTLSGSAPLDVRWLTTLFTQSAPASE